MLRVSGRVVVKESGVGVANVKVVAFDVAAIASATAEPVTDAQATQGGVSLGSEITSTDGSFAIKHDAGDGGQPGRELFLIVGGPESEARPTVRCFTRPPRLDRAAPRPRTS